jgi:hypothetical protein
MAAVGDEILEVIRNHQCGIVGAEEAHDWPEFQALVARLKAAEGDCQEAKLAEVRRGGAY